VKQLILDCTPFCTRTALVEDGELLEFFVEMTGARGIVGNIYKGRVKNVLSGMKAAFVDIGLERNGFLYFGESLVDKSRLQSVMPARSAKLAPGDVIMCQVTKDQFGQKGARLTTDITLAGCYLVLVADSQFIGVSRKIENERRKEYLESLVKSICPENIGFIVRSAAEKANDEEIIEDAKSLLQLWEKVKKDYKTAPEKSVVFEEASLFERELRDTFSEDLDVVVVNDENMAAKIVGSVGGARIEVYSGARNIMAHYGLSAQINHLCDRKVPLSNGAYIVIDKTEACTVIDVNTGKYVGTSDLEDTVFKTNLAAAECIAKQLRKRNIGGIVIIDFIDMTSEAHRQAVIDELKNALKKDRVKTSTVGMTSLGLVELTRKKTRLPIDNFMLQPQKGSMGGFEISDNQLAFLLRDELVDFMLANHSDTVYVGIYPGLYELITNSEILHKHIRTTWADTNLYFYSNEDLRRDRFLFGVRPPFPTPEDMRCLTE